MKGVNYYAVLQKYFLGFFHTFLFLIRSKFTDILLNINMDDKTRNGMESIVIRGADERG